MSHHRETMGPMKGSDRTPQRDRVVRILAAIAGLMILVAFVLSTAKLIGSLQASAAPISTSNVAVGVFVLCELVVAALIARHIWEHGSDGARQVGSLLKDTALVPILGGLAGAVLAAGSFSAVADADGWGARLLSVLSAMFWAAVGVHSFRNGCRRWATRHQSSRNRPAIEHIPPHASQSSDEK